MYLNTDQAARFLGFVRSETQSNGRVIDVPDRVKLLDYLKRWHVPTFHRGRCVVVRDSDLEKSLRPRDGVPATPLKRRSA